MYRVNAHPDLTCEQAIDHAVDLIKAGEAVKVWDDGHLIIKRTSSGVWYNAELTDPNEARYNATLSHEEHTRIIEAISAAIE